MKDWFVDNNNILRIEGNIVKLTYPDNEEIVGIFDNKLHTKFRGHLINEWPFHEIEYEILY
jgi:hypothetical protein